MMTLLSLYLSTHVPLFLCVSVSQSALSSSFPLSSRVRRWLHSSNGCLLNLTSECNLCSLIQFCADSLPSQCWPNTTKRSLFVSNVTHFHFFYSTGTSTGAVTDCIPTSILITHTHTWPSPKQYTHSSSFQSYCNPIVNDVIVLRWR